MYGKSFNHFSRNFRMPDWMSNLFEIDRLLDEYPVVSETDAKPQPEFTFDYV